MEGRDVVVMRIEDDGVSCYESAPGALGQFLMRVYRGNGPTIRTVCWRQSPADTWGPEHMLLATAAEAAS